MKNPEIWPQFSVPVLFESLSFRNGSRYVKSGTNSVNMSSDRLGITTWSQNIADFQLTKRHKWRVWLSAAEPLSSGTYLRVASISRLKSLTT